MESQEEKPDRGTISIVDTPDTPAATTSRRIPLAIGTALVALIVLLAVILTASGEFNGGESNENNLPATVVSSDDQREFGREAQTEPQESGEKTGDEDVEAVGFSEEETSADELIEAEDPKSPAPSDPAPSTGGGDKGKSSSSVSSGSASPSQEPSPVAPDPSPAPAPVPAPEPKPAPEPEPAPAEMTVSIRVDASAAVAAGHSGNSTLVSKNITLEAGSTVLDALRASGVSVNVQRTAMGSYVQAIGGIAEKQYGGRSGWVFIVDGVSSTRSSDSIRLSGGETVVWKYVV